MKTVRFALTNVPSALPSFRVQSNNYNGRLGIVISSVSSRPVRRMKERVAVMTEQSGLHLFSKPTVRMEVGLRFCRLVTVRELEANGQNYFSRIQKAKSRSSYMACRYGNIITHT